MFDKLLVNAAKEALPKIMEELVKQAPVLIEKLKEKAEEKLVEIGQKDFDNSGVPDEEEYVADFADITGALHEIHQAVLRICARNAAVAKGLGLIGEKKDEGKA